MAGSIEKRGKNSYRLSCLAGYNLQGKPIKKTKTVHGTKKEAEIELAKFVADVQNGMVIEGKSLKFSEFTEIWKRDYGSKELAPSTYKRYCRMLETRLLPYFGHFYVNKIKPTDIMQFYDLLSKDTQLVRKKDNDGNKISETGKWVDVGYRNRGDFPQMLSNLFPYNFKFRGKKLNSIENFFQGIKFKDKKVQNYVFAYYGTQAVHIKAASSYNWKETGEIYWQGKPIKRESKEYELLRTEIHL